MVTTTLDFIGGKMKLENKSKKNISKKLLACAISLSVLTIGYNDAFASEAEEQIVDSKEEAKPAKTAESENDLSEPDLKDGDSLETDDAEAKSPKEDITDQISAEDGKDQASTGEQITEDEPEKTQENPSEDLELGEKLVEEPVKESAEEIIEWEKVSDKGKDVEEAIIEETRYNKLESTEENDNGANIAGYTKEAMESDPSGNTNVSVEFIDDSEPNQSRFGVFIYHKDHNNNIFVGYDKGGWFWEYKNNGQGEWLQGNRVKTPERGAINKLNVSIKADGQLNATNNGDSVFDTKVIPPEVFENLKKNTGALLKLGSFNGETTKVYVKTSNQEGIEKQEADKEKGPEVDDSQASYETLESSQMKATIDTLFPRVKEYDYKGEKFKANVEYTDTLMINGVEVKPEVSYEKRSKSEAVYKLKVKDEKNHIDAEFDVVMKLLDNQLHFDIENIKNNNNIKGGQIIDNPALLLETIDFRNNFLATVTSDQEEASFDGAKMSTNTHHKGDRHIDVTNPMGDVENDGYMYGFVSNKNTAAGVWSNSQFNYGGGSNDYTRLTINKKTYGDVNHLGIASSPYIYQKAYEGKDGKYKVYDERTWLNPASKVILTQDANDDGKVDWQDGAIAYRKIMNNPKGHEYVKDLVGQRIAMNFGSQAQNPFLTTLDGIKKVYLNTDGLGQMVLLKGYGSEGHDSGHLDYDDIGKRIGGAEDFVKLLELGEKYGARIGIHVNASETYPESDYFEPDRLRKDKNGNFAYGWNWIDQGINIDAEYDLAHGRFDRFKDLHKIVGDKLDFVYVDVWGNGQSGNNSAWMTHIISKELNDLGWRSSYEWGFAGEYDSTFQHWAADLTYGGYSLKGINSDIVRFIRNHQKDSWAGNFPAYGGAAKNPLLGGYDMKDFEGWQGRSDWAGFMENIFKTNLPTKFVQHYKVYNWKNGQTVNMQDNNETYQYNPEMEIRLRNDKENYDELVIRRKSNDVNDPGYMQRVMTLNGKTVFEDGKYLLPWEQDGKEKLYHYNPEGGQTSWQALDGWTGQVYVYELTDLGKTNEKVLDIVDGKINLDAKANTAYVIYKDKAENEEVKWSEGMGIEDVGFNSKSLDHWDIEGDKDSADIVLSQGSNPMLRVKDNSKEVSLSQKIKGLKPNTKYAIYVGIDNRSDAKAYIDIKVDGKVISNYTEKSIAPNYVQANAHNTLDKNATVDNSSYFQNMYVYFTTGDDPSNTIVSLRREAGSGASYFDDLRVFENKSQMYENGHDLKDGDFYQDFENVGQGIFPFVIGNVEGVQDNRTHLAEKNAPYTQKGWNGKVINDVIEGKWSVKTNGLTGRNRLVYQTIPQNFRFKEGQSYQVVFDYEAGSDGTYAFVVGEGEYTDPSDLKVYSLDKSWEEGSDKSIKRASFLVDGGKQKWIGILSTSKAADTKGTGGNEANFRSYKDFMLDNLLIRQVEKNAEIIKDDFEKNFSPVKNLEDYQEESVRAYQDAMAKLVGLDTENANVDEVQALIDDVYAKRDGLKTIKTSIDKTDIESAKAVGHPGEGIENAFDKNPSSIWHSPWNDNSMGETVDLVLAEETVLKDFIYLPRQSGSNGRIKDMSIVFTDQAGNEKTIELTGIANSNKPTYHEFDEPIKAKKIKIVPSASYGDRDDFFLSAAEFIFGLKDVEPGHEPIDYEKLEAKLENPKSRAHKDLADKLDYLKANDLISQPSYEKIIKDIDDVASRYDQELEKAINSLVESGIPRAYVLSSWANLPHFIEDIASNAQAIKDSYKKENQDTPGSTDETYKPDLDSESTLDENDKDEDKPSEDKPSEDEQDLKEEPDKTDDQNTKPGKENPGTVEEGQEQEADPADKTNDQDKVKIPSQEKESPARVSRKANISPGKDQNANKIGGTNVKTGVSGLSKIVLALVGSAAGLFKSKKRK